VRAGTVPTVRLTSHSWTEVADRGPVVVAVPIGSCEQHGPHLPLDTDTVIAELLATRLAEREPGVVVGPALTVTASGEHAGFPGTLSIGTAAMIDVVVELGRSADWTAGLVLVNGHGGNRDAVDTAVARLRAESRRVLSWWPRVPGGDAHAGRTETSILLTAAPERVRPAAAVAGTTAPLPELAGALRRDGVRGVSPTGVLGDPTTATAEHGEELLAALGDDLVAAVTAWRGGP
jgi:mycofactocin precursor peptide peptidase